MAPLLPRSDEKGSTLFSHTNRARDFGILFASLIGIVLMVWVVSKLVGGYDLLHLRRRQPHESSSSSSTNSAHHHNHRRERRQARHQDQQRQQQYMNPARFMQLCARHDEQMKKKEKVLLTSNEVDIMAPLTAHRPAGPVVTVAPFESRRGSSSSHSSTSSTDEKTAVILMEPEPTILPHRASRPDDEEAVCCVCLEGFGGEDLLRATRCAHVFHGPCLERWLMRYHSRCPLCQTNLKPGVKQSESGS